MKTPMQELINQVEQWMIEDKEVLENPSAWSNYLFLEANQRIEVKSEFIEMCKEMIEKEKDVIMDAYMEGGDWEELPQPRFDNYYNQTFNTKER
jgi:hypothetical protein